MRPSFRSLLLSLSLAAIPYWSAVNVLADEPTVANAEKLQGKDSGLPELPRPLTSFGAVIAEGHLFVCGGHSGDAHSYSKNEQSDELLVLDLKKPDAWKHYKVEQNIQGLGLVAYGSEVIRVGGFTARNADGEKQALESLDQVASFDVATGKWKSLPSLPAPRSSHDAFVLENRLYVVGGWKLDPKAETVWHSDMAVMDLSAKERKWTTVKVPFERRALALVAFDGKLYAIGGMTSDGAPSTDVAYYDPKSDAWKDGPSVPGEGMEGFGLSAGVVDGELIATTISGKALRLDKKSDKWVSLGTTPTARFFHRLLPHEHALLVVGGGNMETGKFQKIEALTLSK